MPIAVFVSKGGHEILIDDPASTRASPTRSRQEGADAWFAEGARQRFLGAEHDAADYEKIDDISSTSGSIPARPMPLCSRTPRTFPASPASCASCDGGVDEVMYLEGSDQHRGWFQSSLLESCGTRGRAPFDVVLTHGFTLDEKGRKMSKSLGNQTFPQDVIKAIGRRHPAPLGGERRLFRRSAHRPGNPERPSATTTASCATRIRWMLGTLAHYSPADAVGFSAMGELERLMLHRLAELDAKVRDAYAEFDYARVVAALSAFMNADLSAFYFDIRKDALYCDAPSSAKRRGALETIDHIFRAVTLWLAPILVFTCGGSLGARETHPRAPCISSNSRTSRRNGATTRSRRNGRRSAASVRSSPARSRSRAPTNASARRWRRARASASAIPRCSAALAGVDFAEVCITSDIAIEFEPERARRGVSPAPTRPASRSSSSARGGVKCARSWRYFDPKTADPEFPDVSPRDAAALRELNAARRA